MRVTSEWLIAADAERDPIIQEIQDVLGEIHEDRNSWAKTQTRFQVDMINEPSSNDEFVSEFKDWDRKWRQFHDRQEAEENRRLARERANSILSSDEVFSMWKEVASSFETKRRPSDASTAELPKKKLKKQYKKFTSPANEEIDRVRADGGGVEESTTLFSPSSPRPGKLILHLKKLHTKSQAVDPSDSDGFCARCGRRYDPEAGAVICLKCRRGSYCSFECQWEFRNEFCSSSCVGRSAPEESSGEALLMPRMPSSVGSSCALETPSVGARWRDTTGLPPTPVLDRSEEEIGSVREHRDSTGLIPVGLDTTIGKDKGKQPIRNDGPASPAPNEDKFEECEGSGSDNDEGHDEDEDSDEDEDETMAALGLSKAEIAQQKAALKQFERLRRDTQKVQIQIELCRQINDIQITGFQITSDGRNINYQLRYKNRDQTIGWVHAPDLPGPSWTQKLRDYWYSDAENARKRKFIENPRGTGYEVEEPGSFGLFILMASLENHRTVHFETRNHEQLDPGDDRAEYWEAATDMGPEWDEAILRYWAKTRVGFRFDGQKRWVDRVGLMRGTSGQVQRSEAAQGGSGGQSRSGAHTNSGGLRNKKQQSDAETLDWGQVLDYFASKGGA